jgi:DNA-binding transcriptional LysR family regulator
VDPGRIDLNLLRVFEAVMAERHVTRAARRLGLTQSAVSNALARLRGVFADELFVRTPAGMEPTALARELEGPVGAALDAVRGALSVLVPFDPATAETAFALGVSEYAEVVLGPPLVARLREEAPGASVAFRHADRADAFDLIERDAVQLALGVLPEPPAHMTRVMLLKDGFATLMRPGHPCAEGPFGLDRFLEFPHLLVSPTGARTGAVDRALERIGRHRRLAVIGAHLASAAPMLLSSDLLCTAAERLALPLAAAHGLVARATPAEAEPVRLAMVWHRRYDRLPAHAWMRRTVAALAEDLSRRAGRAR